MTPREKLNAALAKPLTIEDIDLAVKCIREVEQLAKQVKMVRDCRMDPPPMGGNEASVFADRVLGLAYHAKWMARKLRNHIKDDSAVQP